MPLERRIWNKTLNYLTQKFEELLNSKDKRFKNFVFIVNNRIKIEDMPKKPGVYIIFEKREPIYVGSTGKGNANLKKRFHDLFYYNKKSYPNKKRPSDPFNHTLTYRLVDPNKIGRFKHPDEVMNFYLDKCSFRLVETETVQEARALESILILQLNPKYND